MKKTMVNILISLRRTDCIAEHYPGCKAKGKTGSFCWMRKQDLVKQLLLSLRVNVMPPRSAMVAFNKSIADELEGLAEWPFPSTFHSLGLEQLKEPFALK